MPDRDTRAVIDALDAAQALSGLTQAEFARALGTSSSRYSTYRTGKVAPTAAFVVRANRIAGAMAAAARRGEPTSISAGQSVQTALESQGETWAFALVLEARDRLVDVFKNRPDLIDAWEPNPRIADEQWASLFAAIIGNTFETHGAAAPRWTNRPPLAEPWLPVESIRFDAEQARQRTPSWLAARNVVVAEHDLATV